jgi:DNA-binding NarL/FixJ family response regulator
MGALHVLLADDHEVLRKGLRSLIEAHPGWTVCGEASNGWQAVELATSLKPQVVVLDVTMPQLNGLEATRKIHRLVPETEILVLTVHGSQHMLREAINAGARGYLLKSDAGGELVAALEAVSQHRYFFSPKVSRNIPELGTGDISEFQKGSSPATPVTPREGEILQLLAEGKSNKDVATLLDISLKTVDTHRTSIMRKLELHSMSELVRYAIRNKIVQA